MDTLFHTKHVARSERDCFAGARNDQATKQEDFAVGGQAVIEGVMMRGTKGYTIAVRHPNGEITVQQVTRVPWHKRNKILAIPVIRGIVVLIESLIIGIRALEFSANIALADEKKDETEKEKKSFGPVSLGLTFIAAFALGIFLFVVVPNVVTQWMGIQETAVHSGSGQTGNQVGLAQQALTSFWFHIIAGFIRILIFLGYIIAISFLKDIRRVFEYHGAEHKSIYTYESGLDLTVANVQQFSTKHPRCGTSFILMVLLVSIFVFALVPSILSWLTPSFNELSVWKQKLVLIPLHILLVLPIAGIAYEINKLAAKKKNNLFVRGLIAPGLWLQRITTKEPDEKQIEVALVALNKTLELSKTQIDTD
ncbi:MAG: DUF1385 domain-containing protein [bacterium]|nr:DUF1385 domain-containing protein [bacterium]